MTVLTARAGMSALLCASLFGYAAAGAAADAASGKTALSARDEHHYAITLESSSAADIKPSKPLPKAFEDFRLYRTSLIRDGKKIYAVRVGFFATEAAAQAAREQLAATFPNAKVVEIGARERDDVLAASRPPALGPKKPSRAADARHYVVNLATLFKPPLVGDIAKEFPQRVVYAAQTSVFDEEFYFLRVGFFSTFFEAETARQAALAKYPRATVKIASETEYRLAMKLPPVPEPPAETARKDIPPPAPREERHYAVTLESSAAADAKPSKPLPKAFQDLPLYRTSIVQDGKRIHVVRLGFFATEAEAEAARKQLAAVFPNAKVAQVAAPERDEALRVTRAAELKRRSQQAAPRRPEPPKIAAPSAGPDAEREADALMQAGREAFTAERYKSAVDAFSKILAMPPNAQSKDALEFRGLAYERLGDTDHAGVDYNAYLDRHPQGEDAERMRQRLSNLEPPPEPEPLKEVKRQEDAQTQIFGGVSQYYYKGNSKIETQDTTPGTQVPGSTLSLTDQKALITTVDLNIRSRSPTADSRWVFRDTASYNFLPNGDDRNRITAAYYDYKYKPADFAARVGRQSGAGNGVPGRFDGATASHGIAPRWRIGGVAGTLVDSPPHVDQAFTGVYGEFGPFGSWSGNLYLIQQDADGMTDRKAIGTELRYFDAQRSVFSVLDYDVYFGELNIALVQGSWTTPENTVYSFMLDRRKTPSLQSTTALLGFDTSLESLRQTLSEEEIKRRAQGLTAVSELASLGVTVPFSSVWQLGGDINLSRISGIEGAPAVNGINQVPSTESSGTTQTYSVRAIGTALFSQRDVSVLGVTAINAPTFDGLFYTLTSRAPVGERWSFDLILTYSSSETSTNATTDRFSPTLRVGYRWRDNITFEAELGVENSRTENPATQTADDTKRNYFSLGYRWDF